jgi:phosphate/phosphite/phosphonate ABC transporter binding protein
MPMIFRRITRWWLFALLLASLAFRPAAARDLEFGITPVLGQSTMETDFDPLMAYLSQALGEKVVLYVAKDYGDLRTQMESGAVDIGSFSPFSYVDAVRGGKVRIIAQSLIEGAASYRGVIVVRRDSGLQNVADLRGKRFAYVDPKSASGYVYPRAMLIARGIDPDHFFQTIFFAGDHNRVIAAVLDGRADAGAVYDGSLRIAKAAGVPTDDLAILLSTEPIPHDAIAVRIGLDAGLAGRIQTALVKIAESEMGRRVITGNKKGLTGFVAATDSQFDVVRQTARAAGL